jgi:uncharacterized membrane protein
MIAPPHSLVTLLKPWADFYGHSKLIETIVMFLHIGGLLLAGGFAVAADRGTFRAMTFPAEERSHYMTELAAVHRWVLIGLVIIASSGLLLLASDIETFLGSWIFWFKMLLVLALVINGFQMTQVERQLATDASQDAPAWGRLHRIAATSLSLWFTTALAGVALSNVP